VLINIYKSIFHIFSEAPQFAVFVCLFPSGNTVPQGFGEV